MNLIQEPALIFETFFEGLGGLRPLKPSKNKQERYIQNFAHGKQKSWLSNLTISGLIFIFQHSGQFFSNPWILRALRARKIQGFEKNCPE